MPTRRTSSASHIERLAAEMERLVKKMEPLASTVDLTDERFERSAVATFVYEHWPAVRAELKKTASTLDDPREPKEVEPRVLRLFKELRRDDPKISVSKAAPEISKRLPRHLSCGPDHIRRILGKAGKARRYSAKTGKDRG